MFTSLLNKTGEVKRKVTVSSNSFNEQIFQWSTVTTIALALQPIKEELRYEVGGTTYVATNQGFCDFGVDIEPGDKLIVDSVEYLVLAVMNDGGRDHHYKLILSKV
ncbi:MAG: hypothetical protein DRP09_13070 [Candidatus Thorarchaeota archaeon]|nr:MAG: hypothetical protein DRP09_13070 [Candidatus Thorarchaeota archaeon]